MSRILTTVSRPSTTPTTVASTRRAPRSAAPEHGEHDQALDRDAQEGGGAETTEIVGRDQGEPHQQARPAIVADADAQPANPSGAGLVPRWTSARRRTVEDFDAPTSSTGYPRAAVRRTGGPRCRCSDQTRSPLSEPSSAPARHSHIHAAERFRQQCQRPRRARPPSPGAAAPAAAAVSTMPWIAATTLRQYRGGSEPRSQGSSSRQRRTRSAPHRSPAPTRQRHGSHIDAEHEDQERVDLHVEPGAERACTRRCCRATQPSTASSTSATAASLDHRVDHIPGSRGRSEAICDQRRHPADQGRPGQGYPVGRPQGVAAGRARGPSTGQGW